MYGAPRAHVVGIDAIQMTSIIIIIIILEKLKPSFASIV